MLSLKPLVRENEVASTRRTSARKPILHLVEKACFKKRYKPKLPASCQQDNKSNLPNIESTHSRNIDFQNCVPLFFKRVDPERRQSKALQNFRAKKLKQVFLTEENLKEVVGKLKISEEATHPLLHLRRTSTSGKSKTANCKIRDKFGRFTGSFLSQSISADFRDECRTLTQTTADGSYLSLLSFPNHGDTHQPQAVLSDFDSIFGFNSYQRGHRSSLDSCKPSVRKPLIATSVKLIRESPLELMETNPKIAEDADCMEAENLWGVEDDGEGSVSRSHLQGDMLKDYFEDDGIEDLFSSG